MTGISQGDKDYCMQKILRMREQIPGDSANYAYFLFKYLNIIYKVNIYD